MNFWTRVGNLILFMLPVGLAMTAVLLMSQSRAFEVVDHLNDYLESGKELPVQEKEKGKETADCATDRVARRFNEFKKTVEAETYSAWNEKDGARHLSVAWFQCRFGVHPKGKSVVDCVVLKNWGSNAILATIMTLLPFLALAWALGQRNTRDRLTVTLRASDGLVTSVELPGEVGKKLRGIALQSTPMKFALAFLTAAGWMYLMHPNGIGADAVDDFLVSEYPASGNTLPTYLRWDCSPAKCVLAGFLGWYILLLATFVRKAFQSDVLSDRSFSFFFRRALLVIGLSIIMPIASKDASVLVVFLVGLTPFSLQSLIQQSGTKWLGSRGDDSADLLKLPTVFRANLVRLEEEGIDSADALAGADFWSLMMRLPLSAETLMLWQDGAILLAVVGGERYEKVSKVCLRATEFVRRAADPALRKTLEERSGIENAEEIAVIISRTYGSSIASWPKSSAGVAAQGAGTPAGAGAAAASGGTP